MLSNYVVDTDSVDLWAMQNALCGILVLWAAKEIWWRWPLFGLLLIGCLRDVFLWRDGVGWEPFKHAADVNFLAEEAVFYVGGILHAAHLIALHVRSGSIFRLHRVLRGRQALNPRGA